MNTPAEQQGSRKPDLALTALDWIAVILVLLLAGALLSVPVAVLPDYERAFDQFGGRAVLPDLTMLVMKPMVPILLGLLQVLLLLPGVYPRRFRIERIGWRRFWIVLAFFAGLFAAAMIWLGLYLPIFELNDAVSA